jgi:hypothetical protein
MGVDKDIPSPTDMKTFSKFEAKEGSISRFHTSTRFLSDEVDMELLIEY